MAFVRVKPAGWAFGEILTSAQMNTLDTDHAAALDPVGGGNYNALADALTISGDNITLGAGTDVVTVGNGGSSTLIVNAATDFQQGVNCSAGTSTFTTAVTVNDTFTCSGNVNLGNAAGDAIAVAGTSTFTAPATFEGNVTLGNAAGDAIAVGGTTTFSQPFICSGAGRIRFRAPGTINDAAGSLVVTTTNFYRCLASTLSADRTWTIDDTGAADGDWLIVKNFDTGFTITVNSPAAVNLGNLREGTAIDWGFFMRIGGAWFQMITGS